MARSQFVCRFCNDKVSTDGAICFTCQMEGRSTEPGIPSAHDYLDMDYHGFNREPEQSSHNQYHGDSIRDDI